MASFQLHSFSLGGIPLSMQFASVVAVAVLLSFIYKVHSKKRSLPGFPIIDLQEERKLNSQESWRYHSTELIEKGFRTCSGPFQIMTGTGPRIILPLRFADEVKSHPDLNFEKSVASDLFSEYPGFEGMSFGLKHPRLIADLVRMKLTQSLGLVTDALVDETTASVHDLCGEDPLWTTVVVKEMVGKLVSRLSSRVFLGKPLCRDQRWLEIARGYTMQVFLAAREMRPVSPFLRPIKHWFFAPCIKLRQQSREARNLIIPVIRDRRERAEKALATGLKPPKTEDTVGWMVEMAKETISDEEYVHAQLGLTIAAIHTTTEALSVALFDVCNHPEVVQPLREEIIQVIGEEGWSKTGLYKLRYMDSFLKESQRFTPVGIGSLNRLVIKDITLSDGSVLPKGARTLMPGSFMDPEYEDTTTFKAGRFLEMRKQDDLKAWQYVTVTKEHNAFGYGVHACPGRFFVSNELKIALAHLLLKYDFQLIEGEKLRAFQSDGSNVADPRARIQMRRREEEIRLDLDL